MNGFSGQDNIILVSLGKVFDVVFLSLLWLVFSIPIVTMGAATTALYYTSVKVIRRERGYIFREFFKSFRLNFVTATIAWVVLALLGVLFVNNIQFALAMEGISGKVLTAVYCFLMFLIVGIFIYLFPVLSRFTIKLLQLSKISLFMAFKHLPITIMIVMILAVGILGVYLFFPAIIVVPCAACLLESFAMEKVLKKYTPKAEDGENKDEWYLE